MWLWKLLMRFHHHMDGSSICQTQTALLLNWLDVPGALSGARDVRVKAEHQTECLKLKWMSQSSKLTFLDLFGWEHKLCNKTRHFHVTYPLTNIYITDLHSEQE